MNIKLKHTIFNSETIKLEIFSRILQFIRDPESVILRKDEINKSIILSLFEDESKNRFGDYYPEILIYSFQVIGCFCFHMKETIDIIVNEHILDVLIKITIEQKILDILNTIMFIFQYLITTSEVTCVISFTLTKLEVNHKPYINGLELLYYFLRNGKYNDVKDFSNEFLSDYKADLILSFLYREDLNTELLMKILDILSIIIDHNDNEKQVYEYIIKADIVKFLEKAIKKSESLYIKMIDFLIFCTRKNILYIIYLYSKTKLFDELLNTLTSRHFSLKVIVFNFLAMNIEYLSEDKLNFLCSKNLDHILTTMLNIEDENVLYSVFHILLYLLDKPNYINILGQIDKENFVEKALKYVDSDHDGLFRTTNLVLEHLNILND